MKSDAPHPAATPAAPVTAQAPFASALAPEPVASSYDNPFETGDVAVHEGVHEAEDDPFAHIAVAVAEPETAVEIDDPFAEGATEIHDADRERAELDGMLANARAIVASLETALERARENERVLTARVHR